MDPVLHILHTIDSLLVNIRDNSGNTEQGIENGKDLLNDLIRHLNEMRNDKDYIREL